MTGHDPILFQAVVEGKHRESTADSKDRRIPRSGVKGTTDIQARKLRALLIWGRGEHGLWPRGILELSTSEHGGDRLRTQATPNPGPQVLVSDPGKSSGQ